MSEIAVREMRAGDLEQVNALRACIQQLHHKGRPDLFLPASAAHGELARQFMQRENGRVLVAARGERVLGYAVTQDISREANPYMLARRFVHVEEFCVDANHRREGVGRALAEAIRTDARARGFARVELDVWAFNEDARCFYEAMGFYSYRCFMELDTGSAQA